MAAGSDLDQARIAVTVGDEHIVVGIPGDVGGAIEGAHAAIGMQSVLHVQRSFEPTRLAFEPPALLLQHRLEIIDGLRRAAELFERHCLRTVLDDHPRAFVDLPDVVVPVNADGMRKRRGIVVGAPFLDERAVRVEFPQHGCRAAAGNALWVRSRVDENVVLGVDVDAHCLAHRVAWDEQLKNFFVVLQLWRLGIDRILLGLLFLRRYLRVNASLSARSKKRGDEDTAFAFHLRTPSSMLLQMRELFRSNERNGRVAAHILHPARSLRRFFLFAVAT